MSKSKLITKITSALQLIGASIFIFYLLGYIGVNSYYVKNGFFSFEIINTQMISAGVLFSVVYGIYAFLIGRRIYHFKTDKEKFIEIGNEYRYNKLWKELISVFMFSELYFAILIGSYWTSRILFETSRTINNLTIIFAIVFIIDYFFVFRSGLYDKKPYIAVPLAFIYFNSAIFFGLLKIDNFMIFIIIIYYLLASAITYFIIDTHRRSDRSYIFTAFWAFIVLGIFTITFGTTLYGSIRSEVGGGKPRPVKLITINDATGLAPLLNDTNNNPKEVFIIGETSTELFINAGTTDNSKPLRIFKNSLLAIQPIIIKNNISK